jgi:hypothetical protein
MTLANLHRVLFIGMVSVGATSAAQAAPCDTPGFQQFDFWIGDWQVHTPDGKLAGVNRIERQYDGCLLHESYSTERGYRGQSLNIYDASRDVWHQTWVDNSGLLLVLEGHLVDGKMVLEGTTTNEDKTVTKHRITWSKNADGSVRQFWQSTDANNQWQTTFDGRYTKK